MEPFIETLNTVAKRIEPDGEFITYEARVASRAESPEVTRHALIKIGMRAEKISRDIQEALNGYDKRGVPTVPQQTKV